MDTGLDQLPTRAVFYFRTLGRWPGGNADMLTVKVTMRLAPDAELEAQFYSCFDGRHAWYPPRRVAIDPGDALASFLDLTRSLAKRGNETLVLSPFDPAEDEWDSEWGESEIYLFATDEGPETPEHALLRLVRRPTKVMPRATPADRELERAFELAARLTGVGRVFEFANTRDALSAAYRAQGEAGIEDRGYADERTPAFLPPETDAAFLELQAHATSQRAAEQTTEQATRQPPAGRETILLYRLDEVPEFLTRELAADASVRRCLFFAPDVDSQVIPAMLTAVPEREHDDTTAALEVASTITAILTRSEDYAWLRGAGKRGGDNSGFHGGDAEAVERWLATQDIERVSPRIAPERLILLRPVGDDGAPFEQVDKLTGDTVRTEESLGHGLFVFDRDRDHDHFKLAPVQDEEPDPDDQCWHELHASDLPPGEIHTVILSERPTPKKAKSKKAPAKKAAAKKAAAKKTAAKKTAAKKTAAKKTAAKKTSTKKTPAQKTAAKKATAKKATAKKATAKKTPAKKTPAKKTTAKKATAKKATAKKATAKRR